ncbi:MAG: alpha-1,4-glucan--maltose-1-phosphate maltosyltransferase [Taibaiella sp.]|nr:alpha-1,4-glucan--maltose-1-phosphate maltosyltransferase [Taibaiella sp.]
MINVAGRRRIVINNVMPSVEGGRYPAKTIVNQPLRLSANIFADGHELIECVALIKHKTDKLWVTLPLLPEGNDVWATTFIPDRLGMYQLLVQAWIDHFGTWQHGLVKKFNAGQDIDTEIKNGLLIAEQAAAKAVGKNKIPIADWIEELRSATGHSEAVAIATNVEIGLLLAKSRDKALITTSHITPEIEVERERALFSTWYELFPRSAAAAEGTHGSFKDMLRLLPRISRMGFDVLYLPPIHPIGELKRKGRNNSLTAAEGDHGSPWAIGTKEGGHKALHPELGTIDDFKLLINTAQQAGIEIAMDIAFQCAPDHPYVAEHPEWFKWRADGTVQYAENPPKRYEDILPFNFETEAWQSLWVELRSIMEYWIERGIEIFRVDNPHTKSFMFWEWAIREIKTKYPRIIFLAEAFTRPRVMEQLAKLGFTQSYTYFTWRNTRRELEDYITELTTSELKYYFRPNLWPNTPDILPPELTTGGENNHIIRLLLAATLSSSYGIYGPVYEMCLREPIQGKEEYIDNEKYQVWQWDWDTWTKTGEIAERINRVRKENPALQTTNNIQFAATDNDNIICYIKADESRRNVLIIVVNLDPFNTQNAVVNLPLQAIGKEPGERYQVEDLLSGDIFEWTGAHNYVSLNPYELPAHILRIQQPQ